MNLLQKQIVQVQSFCTGTMLRCDNEVQYPSSHV